MSVALRAQAPLRFSDRRLALPIQSHQTLNLAKDRELIVVCSKRAEQSPHVAARACGLQKEEFMRALAIVAVASAGLSLSSLGAEAGPWCADYGHRGGGTNCGFYSFEQCLQTVRGTG